MSYQVHLYALVATAAISLGFAAVGFVVTWMHNDRLGDRLAQIAMATLLIEALLAFSLMGRTDPVVAQLRAQAAASEAHIRQMNP